MSGAPWSRWWRSSGPCRGRRRGGEQPRSPRRWTIWCEWRSNNVGSEPWSRHERGVQLMLLLQAGRADLHLREAESFAEGADAPGRQSLALVEDSSDRGVMRAKLARISAQEQRGLRARRRSNSALRKSRMSIGGTVRGGERLSNARVIKWCKPPATDRAAESRTGSAPTRLQRQSRSGLTRPALNGAPFESIRRRPVPPRPVPAPEQRVCVTVGDVIDRTSRRLEEIVTRVGLLDLGWREARRGEVVFTHAQFSSTMMRWTRPKGGVHSRGTRSLRPDDMLRPFAPMRRDGSCPPRCSLE